MTNEFQFDLSLQVEQEILAKIAAAENEATLEVIRVSELGSKGRITTIARLIGSMPPELRKHNGAIINQVKHRVEEAIGARKKELKERRIAEETGSAPGAITTGVQSSVRSSIGKSVEASIPQTVTVTTTVIRDSIDVTLPVRESAAEVGRVHPITQVIDELTAIFADMGFAVAEGPDIETDDYNFTKLNFPQDHPARDMQDTFFFNPKPDG
ncbi:MAG TPA: hypothetical protein VK430_06115, partial [Xanthobacteraceae bacterium]|nr:hypothetical protein [Xanthobacteraceae bacterium]